MIILNEEFDKHKRFNENVFVALGSFDGLHAGHIELINKVISLSLSTNSKSMIYTFKNHPLSIINKEIAPKLLLDYNTKLQLLNDYGIDIVDFVSFDKKLMRVSPENFIENLVKSYNVKGIVVGFNYRFGYKNLGDIQMLKKICDRLNVKVYVLPPVKIMDEIVSSSKIRMLISEGEIEKANVMLNRPFSISGKVLSGKKIGRTIGFPTVNIDYDKVCILPKGGVYFTNILHEKCLYKGITNVGYNPTVHNNKLSIETHILNFNKEIYGEYIKVFFINRIRDEKKFDSLNSLKGQLQIDKNYALSNNINEKLLKNNLQL